MKVRTAKVALIAPTGYGKSTVATMIRELCPGAVNIKLAAPLYALQEYIYGRIGVENIATQDGELLQFLGYKIQREAPHFLASEFQRELSKYDGLVPLVTNDDCRPHNYSTLRNLGFQFVRVLGIHRSRSDHSPVDPHHPVEQGLEELDCGFVLDNRGSKAECRAYLEKLLPKLNVPVMTTSCRKS